MKALVGAFNQEKAPLLRDCETDGSSAALHSTQLRPPERGLGPGVEQEQEGGEGGLRPLRPLRPPRCRLSPHPLTAPRQSRVSSCTVPFCGAHIATISEIEGTI